MSDREHIPEKELEQELKELGTRIEHPPTPDLAHTVRSRISEEELRSTRRGWRSLPRHAPQWAVAAVLLLVVAIPVFSPTARDTLSGWFPAGAGGAGAEGGVQQAVESAGSDRATREPSASSESQGAGATATPDMPSSGRAASSESLPSSAAEGPLPPDQNFDRKIIKTADLGIRSKNVRRSAATAQQIATGFGGSVQSSRIQRGDDPVSASLVLTVPAPEFEKALDELRDLGQKVTTDSVSGEDVTEEFVDLESRERNLLAAERSLLELYDESESVNDSLSIQRELTNVRGQIEQVQGRIEYLEQRTDSSRIELTIHPVRDGATSETGWSPLNVASQAWDASLGVLQALATTAISIAVFSWWLIPLPVAGFMWWRQRHRAPDDDPDSP